MKRLFNHPSTKLWYLIGIMGLALSTFILLDEGQARTLSSVNTPTISSNNQSVLPSNPSSTISSKNSRTSSTNRSSHQATPAKSSKTLSHKKPAKKQAGLAILFLSLLAEKA